MCLSEPKASGEDSRPTHRSAFDRKEALGLPPEACTVSWPKVMLPEGNYTGPKVLCGSCCVVVTGTQRVAVQTSHLPSSGSGLPKRVAPRSMVSRHCYHSLIDPNRPQRTEFIRMRNAHLEPLRRDHIRTKLPVRPSTQLAQLPIIALAARPAGTRRNNRNRTVGK